MKYGLIGESVSQSFSKEIHEELGYEYELCSLNREEFASLLKSKNFKGINVTIPYKEFVLDFLDEKDQSVKLCGCCNCIVNQDSKIVGYNTDYYGFKYLIDFNNIDLKDKNVLILGTGGTSKTVRAVLEEYSPKNVYVASRNKKDLYVSYVEANMLDINVIINTTPNGMVNRSDDILLYLKNYKHLESVIDVIYNPLRTRLLLQAKENGINYYNGLLMLVVQAIKAGELFLHKKISLNKTLKIYRTIKKNRSNVVLIGMPCCGKTKNGRALAEKLGYSFYDIDKVIEEKAGMSINEIFAKYGETYFRKLEADTVLEYSKLPRIVISTGGGVVKSKENMVNLAKNGLIIFLDRNLDKMTISGKRPLIKSKEDYQKLYDERIDLYREFCDIEIFNTENVETNVSSMEEAIYENSCR